MIEGLKPYAEYKESGAPWFGTVPEHWSVGRLGAVFGERGETNERREVTDILSVMKDRGVIPYAEKGRVGNKASDDVGRYKIVRPDDLVVNCMNVIIGSVGRSRYTGCLSPVYYVLKRRKLENDPRFLELVFQHKQFQRSLVRIGNGILAHRMRIPMEKLKAEMFPIPPPDEQAAIVRFLDHANRKIDGFIRAKRKLIGLLNEQKQAIIHSAVTRGLDPDVKLKDSGIPWLGEIPEHWEVRRAKYLFREVDDRSKDGKETHLAMSQRLGLVPSSMVESAMRSESYAGAKLCQEGDLVLNRLKAHLGVFALAKQGGVISPDYSVFRKRATISMEYYESVLKSSACRRELRIRAKGLVEGFWRLYTDDFYDIRLPVPPFEEQKEVMSVATVETVALTTAIARTEREIALMLEYRTRLTADIVTGKLDVREAAAKLPEVIADEVVEPPADEPIDETETDEGVG